MGMSVGAKGKAQADINVTPLVDIVLVLLIIFMVITPMLTRHLPIEVPQKAEVEEPQDDSLKDQVVLKLFADGHIELNKQPMADLDALRAKLLETYENRTDKVMFFDGEDDAPYGAVVQLMDLARGSGVATIGVMTPKDEADTEGDDSEGGAEGGEAPATP